MKRIGIIGAGRFGASLAESLAEHGADASPERCRRLAIAINGLLDGLWLEGCLAGELFGDSELVEIALTSIEALLGLRLKPIEADGGKL